MSKRKRTFNHGDYESRRRKAVERLGMEGKCPFCGEDDPFCLHVHHVAGQEFDDTTVILCLNHHAKITNAQKDHPPKIENCTDPSEVFAHIVLGIIELLWQIIDMLQRVADHLLDRARQSSTPILEGAP